MLDTFRALVAEITGGTRPQDRFAENDYRLAAAALLVHALAVDGRVTQAERRRLHALLQSRFDLDAAAADDLISEATLAEGDSVDLYRFTSQLNRSLDEQGRLRIIEMMWEIIYTDGHVNEFEDNLVWRVADLLHVPSRDRIELRRRVAETRGETVDRE
jgi:uncharacterized tellurite resistance protein B-like protein